MYDLKYIKIPSNKIGARKSFNIKELNLQKEVWSFWALRSDSLVNQEFFGDKQRSIHKQLCIYPSKEKVES